MTITRTVIAAFVLLQSASNAFASDADWIRLVLQRVELLKRERQGISCPWNRITRACEAEIIKLREAAQSVDSRFPLKGSASCSIIEVSHSQTVRGKHFVKSFTCRTNSGLMLRVNNADTGCPLKFSETFQDPIRPLLKTNTYVYCYEGRLYSGDKVRIAGDATAFWHFNAEQDSVKKFVDGNQVVGLVIGVLDIGGNKGSRGTSIELLK